MESVPDCRVCGACCFSRFEFIVELDKHDFARLTLEEQERLTVFEDGRCQLPTRDDGRCVALVIEDGQFTCSIYPRRPRLCREFERGEEACHYEAKERGAANRELLRDSE